MPFWRASGQRWVSVFGVGTRVHGGSETNIGGGRWGLARAGRGELELATMVGALGAAARSLMVAAVAVK